MRTARSIHACGSGRWRKLLCLPRRIRAKVTFRVRRSWIHAPAILRSGVTLRPSVARPISISAVTLIIVSTGRTAMIAAPPPVVAGVDVVVILSAVIRATLATLPSATPPVPPVSLRRPIAIIHIVYVRRWSARRFASTMTPTSATSAVLPVARAWPAAGVGVRAAASLRVVLRLVVSSRHLLEPSIGDFVGAVHYTSQDQLLHLVDCWRSASAGRTSDIVRSRPGGGSILMDM